MATDQAVAPVSEPTPAKNAPRNQGGSTTLVPPADPQTGCITLSGYEELATPPVRPLFFRGVKNQQTVDRARSQLLLPDGRPHVNIYGHIGFGENDARRTGRLRTLRSHRILLERVGYPAEWNPRPATRPGDSHVCHLSQAVPDTVAERRNSQGRVHGSDAGK